MSAPERQLRIVQVGCLLGLLASSRLALKVQGATHGSPTLRWLFFALGLFCTVDGFVLQRRMVAPRKAPRTQSTPFKRWKAGNLVRLALATSVGLYGLCLSEFGGATWQVDLLLALGITLLLIWTPGTSPDEQDTLPR